MTLLYVGLQDSYPKCGQEWDEDNSSGLVNSLGKILEEIGQLDKRQIAEECVRAADALLLDKKHLAALCTVGIGLECFVDRVYVSEAVQDWSISASESTVTGAMQPAPFLPPQSPYDLSLSTHDASSTLGDSQQWINYLNLLDNTDSSLADSPLLTNTPSESASPFTEPNLSSDPNSCIKSFTNAQLKAFVTLSVKT
ncbi:hypothetical protein PENARI_c017G03964 [Penicillium arizonense]|uniref:Uncharacterized protein n=1 Tax=Penicillium arizonense TaxID=1835702 RepID=A0A1F5LAV0_PENAI|nr:hypothetical protein PENARI_c017G03964 [Penicillium arizonense]OGE50322.1 hypothetical protein PENARI_c017G03964 [Penicillium arizonense]